ncbi:uroporphyrin-III methyltransferase [Acetobacter cibinongensis]|uniref:Uroporphyrin-III methyltransferase n=1 Tax=Acetobacter cibinongensis TaxID=146475 RepID=A0A1Z5YXJ1_9PROT|nr:uroporphyrin-III methyltransferase [Acetobacter cibinongensis]
MFLRRVYEDPTPEGGARVLVDRLWPRGVSKERAHLTLWLKDIAPSTELREWFGHDPARWEGFQQRYKAEVAQNPDAMAQLVALARKGPVTLLFGARNTTENEAVVLAQLLQAACHTP